MPAERQQRPGHPDVQENNSRRRKRAPLSEEEVLQRQKTLQDTHARRFAQQIGLLHRKNAAGVPIEPEDPFLVWKDYHIETTLQGAHVNIDPIAPRQEASRNNVPDIELDVFKLFISSKTSGLAENFDRFVNYYYVGYYYKWLVDQRRNDPANDNEQSEEAKQQLRTQIFKAKLEKEKGILAGGSSKRQIKSFNRLCTNMHIAIDEFGWGILTCPALLRSSKGKAIENLTEAIINRVLKRFVKQGARQVSTMYDEDVQKYVEKRFRLLEPGKDERLDITPKQVRLKTVKEKMREVGHAQARQEQDLQNDEEEEQEEENEDVGEEEEQIVEEELEYA
ncbi:uncharacterized protein EV422DRAFT_566424 [Fimicolochytrium jonesii]|uniref:uncharacterized protein n=1 Tax=Fimicolochytrium jonesii TaxID=1396493 RepID=UPI0022FE648E|nr:uncharacterized protein EV422DRAFT_510260 [Fimicolochytrium jonesii]XP_052926403.1 uncharacterized protein EV422DRAFT_566424 [Fimicolochytrium jonesii]KAI8815906.1 hypothetical protein EV422DRAFT_510260 [Fimicolochytrium jonesii]KAI8821997.1 hypothetical protein EV422DRAFT_566424 [Fimicolochytrium jonesii]